MLTAALRRLHADGAPGPSPVVNAHLQGGYRYKDVPPSAMAVMAEDTRLPVPP